MMLQEIMLLETVSVEAINKDFVMLCMYGDLKAIKKMLSVPSIKEKIDINYQNGKPLREACHYGHIDLVKFLLTSEETKNTNDFIDNGLINACFQDHIEIVKYLLTSSELNQHANVYAHDCKAFIRACEEGRKEIVAFFIFDYNIKLEYPIIEFIQYRPEIKKIFETRELNNKIESSLPKKYNCKTIVKL